jgi:hypothetical protein
MMMISTRWPAISRGPEMLFVVREKAKENQRQKEIHKEINREKILVLAFI